MIIIKIGFCAILRLSIEDAQERKDGEYDQSRDRGSDGLCGRGAGQAVAAERGYRDSLVWFKELCGSGVHVSLPEHVSDGRCCVQE